MRIENFYHKFIISILIYFVCSYFGLFAGYYAAVGFLAVFIFVILFFLLTRKIELVSMSRFPLVWQLLLIYFCFNTLLNLPFSILHMIAFLAGILVLCLKTSDYDYHIIIKSLKIISFILAFSIYAQAFMPDVFYDIARIWFFYSNQYALVYEIGNIDHKFSGAFYEVSFSAFVLSIGYSIIFCNMLLGKVKKYLSWIYLGIIYGAIILTGKRSFILIIPFVSFYIFIINNGTRVTMKRMILYLAIMVVCLFNLITFQELITNILSKGGSDNIQLSSREYFWRIATDMIDNSPIVGEGLNSFDINFNSSGISDLQYVFAGAHNSYIQLFAETGLVGIILFTYAIYTTYICAFKNTRYYASIAEFDKYFLNIFALFSLTTMLLYSVTGNTFYQPQQLIFFFLVSNIIYHTARRKEVKNEDINNCRQLFKG